MQKPGLAFLSRPARLRIQEFKLGSRNSPSTLPIGDSGVDQTLRGGKTPRNTAGIKNRHPGSLGVHHYVSISEKAYEVSKTLKMNDSLPGESPQSKMVKNKSNFFLKTLVLSIAYFDYLGMITSVPKLCV